MVVMANMLLPALECGEALCTSARIYGSMQHAEQQYLGLDCVLRPLCMFANPSAQVDPRDTPVVPENTVQVQATAFAEACANRDMTVTVVADPGLSTATGVTVVTSCGSKVTIRRVTSPRGKPLLPACSAYANQQVAFVCAFGGLRCLLGLLYFNVINCSSKHSMLKL